MIKEGHIEELQASSGLISINFKPKNKKRNQRIDACCTFSCRR